MAVLVLILLLEACARSGISIKGIPPELPAQWRTELKVGPVESDWLAQLGGETLAQLVAEAFANNFMLARQAAELNAAKQQVVIAGASLYPELDLGLSQSRNRLITANTSDHSSHANIELALTWELDLWGQLSDTKRQAVLALKAREASFEQAKLQLASDVSAAWYDVLEARQLIELFEERLANLERNLEIIEFSYRQGITEALDVYLARNEVEQERARLAQQRQSQLEAVSKLQRLLGRYPNGTMALSTSLPFIAEPISAGVPSELLKNRPSVQAAWLELMAADAQLAVAHKARFPSLRLTGAVGDAGGTLNKLFDGGPLAWSLLGGVTQPLFAGGRLAAREKQAQAELKQQEQQYLDHIFTAFREVENSLYKQQTLGQRYQSFLKAQENALAAQRLAFEQYQRGLIPYTSVLEAQRRAFDAQTTVLGLRNQLLQNRIALNLALGGSIASSTE